MLRKWLESKCVCVFKAEVNNRFQLLLKQVSMAEQSRALLENSFTFQCCSATALKWRGEGNGVLR